MLEMSKTVLKKVSFDRKLFKKELTKCRRWLKQEEMLLLKAWCIATFGSTHMDLIMDVFDSVSHT